MRGCNILITEDHALTRFALLTSLKDEDFTGEIFEAENAQNAYKILKEHYKKIFNIIYCNIDIKMYK